MNKPIASPPSTSAAPVRVKRLPRVNVHPNATGPWTPELLLTTLSKAKRFLLGMAQLPLVCSMMSARGYTDAENAVGWELVRRAGAFSRRSVWRTTPAKAILEIEQWSKANIDAARAALARFHPVQEDFVFDQMRETKARTDEVPRLVDFLNALDTLESGTGRGSEVRAGDTAALATLASRGITAVERTRLRELSLAATLTASESTPLAKSDENWAALRALRLWYEDWSATARAVVVRRDHLITLGLAQRRSPKAQVTDPTEPANDTVAETETPTTPATGAAGETARGSSQGTA